MTPVPKEEHNTLQRYNTQSLHSQLGSLLSLVGEMLNTLTLFFNQLKRISLKILAQNNSTNHESIINKLFIRIFKIARTDF